MPNQTLTIRLDPSVEALHAMMDQLEAYAEALELPAKAAYRLAVVCEELAANVAMHGAEGDDGATYVEIVVDREADRLYLTVEDDGRPFDPLARAAPDTTLGLEDREIGGLGVHFVRSMTREVAYVRANGRNRLTAVFNTLE